MTLAGGAMPALAADPAPVSAAAADSQADWRMPPHSARVKVYAARIRTCASTACRAIGTLRYGTRVTVFYHYGGWSNIGPGKWIATYLLTN